MNEWTAEKHKTPQDCRSAGRELKHRPPDYEAGV